MDEITKSFEDFYQRALDSAPQVLAAIVVLIVFIFLGTMASRGIKKFASQKFTPSKKIQLARKLTRWIFYIFGLTIALNILGLSQAASGILAAGGMLTIILGFAFKDLGENLLAGFMMSFSRSFDVGDLIESNEILGVVKEISIRDVHVRQADGIDIFIPSAMIFKNPLNNYTRDGLRRAKFTLGIDYRNDSKKARELIFGSIQKVKGVLIHPAPHVQVAEFVQNHIELEAYFWINTFSEHNNLAEIRTEAMENSLTSLLENNFTVSSEVSTAVELSKQEK